MRLLTVGMRMFLTHFPSLETFFLLCCLGQPCCVGFCLGVLLCFCFLTEPRVPLKKYAFHPEIIGSGSRRLYLSSHGADLHGIWL